MPLAKKKKSKMISWWDLQIGMEVMYVGPGDTGATGIVSYVDNKGFITLERMNGGVYSLHIADGVDRTYYPNATLKDTGLEHVEVGHELYYNGTINENGLRLANAKCIVTMVDASTGIINVAGDDVIGILCASLDKLSFKPIGGSVETPSVNRDSSIEYNTECPACGSPAYQGLLRVECSKGCV